MFLSIGVSRGKDEVLSVFEVSRRSHDPVLYLLSLACCDPSEQERNDLPQARDPSKPPTQVLFLDSFRLAVNDLQYFLSALSQQFYYCYGTKNYHGVECWKRNWLRYKKVKQRIRMMKPENVARKCILWLIICGDEVYKDLNSIEIKWCIRFHWLDARCSVEKTPEAHS